MSEATDSVLAKFASKLEATGHVVLPGTNDDELVVAKDGHRLVLIFSMRELERSLRTGQEAALIVWGARSDRRGVPRSFHDDPPRR